jgi:hypothetical protein
MKSIVEKNYSKFDTYLVVREEFLIDSLIRDFSNIFLSNS